MAARSAQVPSRTCTGRGSGGAFTQAPRLRQSAAVTLSIEGGEERPNGPLTRGGTFVKRRHHDHHLLQIQALWQFVVPDAAPSQKLGRL